MARRKNHHKLRFIFGIFTLAILIAISYRLYQSMGQGGQFSEFVAHYGYIAALLLGFVGGFHFIVPIPSIVFIPVFKQAGLNFGLVALLLAIGMTAAYGVEYLLAKEGWNNIHGHLIEKWTKKLNIWRKKHYALPLGGLFIYTSFIPAPNELSLPIFASLGYSASTVIVVIFFGNFVYNLVYGSGFIQVFSRCF